MKRIGLTAALLAIGVVSVTTSAMTQHPEGGAEVVTVRMVDKSATEYAFEPAEITVAPGTIVRFELTGSIPHNVEFKDVPKGTSLGDAQFGPFLITTGQVYEITIDERFAPGKHKYVCTPHEMMGMTGVINVEPSTLEGPRDWR